MKWPTAPGVSGLLCWTAPFLLSHDVLLGGFPLNSRDTQPPARRPEDLGNLIAYIPCALVLGTEKVLDGNFLELGVESYHMF